MNLASVRDDLKTRLSTVSGLNTYDTVPAKPEAPCAIVAPASVLVHSTFERGSSEVRFTVVVLVQCADWPSAQDALDGYASIGTGAGSVVDALEMAAGGSEDVVVETIADYGLTQVGESQFGTVTFNVLIGMSS